MPGSVPNIHLDMYGAEFRKGYDAACAISAMRQLDKSINEKNEVDAMFLRINKNSMSMVEGLISENLFKFEYKVPIGVMWNSRGLDMWIRISPTKNRQ